jgi:sugar lactone lactonase YvrE
MRRVLLTLAFVMLAVPATAAARGFPETIRLPDGWRPEGIAAGHGTSLYVGSLGTGAIWAGDARTGTGEVRVPPQQGRVAVGIKVDQRNRLFVAGGATGAAYVYDARTGADLATYQLTTGPTFVNDVVVTRRAAYFTDSRNARLYVLPLGRRGELPAQSEVRTLPLTGDFVQVPDATNLNGIEAADGGRTLISVSLVTGKLYAIDPSSGSTREIDLGGATLVNGDGLLLIGRTLFVVRNRSNLIAVVRLDGRLTSGRVVRELTDADFDVPTTLAFSAGRLYTVNARFTTPPTPTTRYDIVRVG